MTGQVGTYYGAPQLEAADAAQDLGHDGGSPIVLHRAPVASDEWRLVRVTVRVTNVSRSGDTWRAEASMGAGGSLPISGLAASRIPSTALVEGRGATITGIVKRAYPTASDQRFSVVPRGPADIQLAAEPGASPTPGLRPRRHRDRRHGRQVPLPVPAAVVTRDPAAGARARADFPATRRASRQALTPPRMSSTSRSTLSRRWLDSGCGSPGTVSNVDGPLATIDDGTGQVVVRAPGPLDSGDTPIAAGDVINAVGYVSERDVGGLEIVVTDPADVARAPALGVDGGATSDPPGTATPTSDAAPGNATSPNTTGGTGGAPLLAGLLVGLTVTGAVASGGVIAVLRRRRGSPARAAGASRRCHAAPGALAAPPNAPPAGQNDPEKQAQEGPDPPPRG